MTDTNHNYQSILANQIEALQNEIAELPRGSLFCSTTGKYRKYYHSVNGQSIYLTAKELPLARQLALKMVLTAKLEDILSEKLALDAYIKKNQRRSKKLDLLLQKKPFLIDLLEDQSFFLFEEDTKKWMDANYVHNTRHPENLIHRSLSNHFVRSKSELIIDTSLYLNKIPYRYECGLELGDEVYFPDFTILHPTTHEIYYWEHFGKMDESIYANNAFYKLRTYCEYGIFPSIHLITTYETKSHPLDPKTVESIIQQYFM